MTYANGCIMGLAALRCGLSPPHGLDLTKSTHMLTPHL